MKRARVPLAVLVVLIALTAASAHGAGVGRTSLLNPDDTIALDLQTWVDLSYVPTMSGVVIVHRAACPGMVKASCTEFPGDEIWLYGRPRRSVLAHELGHRFDYLAMTDRARDLFRRLIKDRRPWRSSPNSPHEQFAEAYGLCFRRKTIDPDNLSTSYGYTPTAKEHRRACKLIGRAAVGAYR